MAESQYLPEVLIHRARDLIQRGEYVVHHHHQYGHQHLTKEVEHEVERIRELVKELEALDNSRHLDREHVHKVEERLLHHENKLSEEIVKLEHAHEIEEGHQGHENRNREGHQDETQIDF